MNAVGCLRLAAVALAASACHDSASSGAAPEPIPECKQYQAKLTACFHRETPFATQESLIPKSEEDRERIRQLCATNLQRLEAACR